MSRRKEAIKREIIPDPKYGMELIARFVNIVMRSGKKAVAERIIYGALDTIGEKKKGANAVDILNQAISNVRPMVEVKSRRVGGATYQVPVEVRADRQAALAMRWLAEAARSRGEKSMGLRLAGEIMDAAENKGSAVKKREDTHRMAEANKAFAHYRW